MKKFFILLIILSASYVSYAQDGPFVYEDHGKRDPLWPLVNSSGVIVSYNEDIQFSEMVLEGIMASGASTAGGSADSVAIVNGKILKKNDRFGLYSVILIAEDRVILQKDKEIFILKLKKEE